MRINDCLRTLIGINKLFVLFVLWVNPIYLYEKNDFCVHTIWRDIGIQAGKR